MWPPIFYLSANNFGCWIQIQLLSFIFLLQSSSSSPPSAILPVSGKVLASSRLWPHCRSRLENENCLILAGSRRKSHHLNLRTLILNSVSDMIASRVISISGEVLASPRRAPRSTASRLSRPRHPLLLVVLPDWLAWTKFWGNRYELFFSANAKSFGS